MTVKIEIEKLNVSELEGIRSIIYNMGDMNTVKRINDRIAYLNGWTNEWKN